jgi:hypothetical protein
MPKCRTAAFLNWHCVFRSASLVSTAKFILRVSATGEKRKWRRLDSDHYFVIAFQKSESHRLRWDPESHPSLALCHPNWLLITFLLVHLFQCAGRGTTWLQKGANGHRQETIIGAVLSQSVIDSRHSTIIHFVWNNAAVASIACFPTLTKRGPACRLPRALIPGVSPPKSAES